MDPIPEREERSGGRSGSRRGRALAAVGHLGALRQIKTLGRLLRQHGVSSDGEALQRARL